MKRYGLASFLLLLLVLNACTTQVPPSQSVPTPVSSTAAPAVPTATVGAPGAIEFPHLGNADLAGAEVPAGLYTSPARFAIPFTLKTASPFRGIYEGFADAQIFGLAQGSASNPPKWLLFWALDPDYSADEVISQLRETPHMTATDAQAVTIAGISATEFDGTADQILEIPALGKFVGHSGDNWRTNSPNPHLRFIALPQAGRTLLIYIEAPQDEFDNFVTEANQVLATVRIEP